MTNLKKRLGQMAVATILATGLLVTAQLDSADAASTTNVVETNNSELSMSRVAQ